MDDILKEEIIHSRMFDMVLTVDDLVFDVLNDHRIKALLNFNNVH